jgi:hypothetical protein
MIMTNEQYQGEPIKEFQDEYRWLSNFHPVEITVFGVVYPSVEHAYMSLKSDDPEWKEFCRTEPKAGKVKRASRDIKLIDGWHDKKVVYMQKLIMKKFEHQDLRDKLMATGDCEIEEGNNHGDEFWGINLKTGKGQNWLGRLIMQEREQIRLFDGFGQ